MKTIDELVKYFNEEKPIQEIIGNYIDLEKKGNNYWAICPFHEDTKPSLSVSPSKKIFKCFSCGSAGNAIVFVQRFKNISFLNSLKEISSLYDMDVSSIIKTKVKVYTETQKLIFQINQAALDFFSFQLEKNFNKNTPIDKYLKERKITLEIIDKYKLGFNPNNELYEFLIKKGYTEEQLELAKIVKDKTSILRNRLIFPIIQEDGFIYGFSGRTLQKNHQFAKYINSQENEVFKKGKILWNLNNIGFKETELLITEGFMDVIAWETNSGTNIKALATMGVAFDRQLISKLKSITNKIIVAFDNDKPGRENAIKMANILVSNGLKVDFLVYENYKDLDELLINTQGSFQQKPYYLWFIDDFLIQEIDINNTMDYDKIPSRVINSFLDSYKNLSEFFLIKKHFNETINLAEMFFREENNYFPQGQTFSQQESFNNSYNQQASTSLNDQNLMWQKLKIDQEKILKIIFLKEEKLLSYIYSLYLQGYKAFFDQIIYSWVDENFQEIFNHLLKEEDYRNEKISLIKLEEKIPPKKLIEEVVNDLISLKKRTEKINTLLKQKTEEEDFIGKTKSGLRKRYFNDIKK